jgi:subtilisin-like proprotein convertase family protein
VPQLGGSSGKPPAAHPPSSPTSFTLYNQNDNGTGNGWTSQDFETAFDGYDSESADDFVVPAGVFWTISGIHVAGRYFNGAGPAPTVHVHFYNDAAGLPGAAACNYLDVVPTDTAGSFDIALPVPCVLGPGTHWVSVIAHMDVGNGGQWGWDDRSVQTGNPSAWRNPGGTFGTPCADFGARVATCGVGAAPDFGFTLTGTAGGVIPPGPPECGESTMYFENATPVPVADVGVVTSTIVVTGADPYLWDLNAVTYLRHTFSADLDVTITSPAGTVVTLTTDNGGGNDDVFNGTVWDDQADPGSQVPYAGSPNLATDHTYANLVTASPLAPEEALGAFIGEDPNGTWTLTISDDLAGDTGTLDGWGLQVTTLPEALRPTLSYLITNSSAVAIPTGPAVVTSTIDASGDPGTFLCGVKATTHILHTFAADLDVTLMSPSGIIVTLTTDNGAGNDNVFDGTVWDDKANPGGQVPYTTNDGLVTDQAYVNLTPVPTLVPEEGMAAFNGQDPRGVWTLTISDDLAGDGGSLDSWGLELKTCTCAIAVPDGPVRVDQHASSGTSNVNGVLESGETVEFEPSWHNSGSGSIILLSPFISNFDGPVGPTYNTVDSGADYGLIAGGTSANCYDASSNCYEVSVTAALRPMQHWDTTLKETANEVSAPGHADAPSGVTTWTLHVGESFPDVPTSNLFYPFIENIFHNGVTGGCAPPPNYCPGNFTLRKQMAVFVLKSKEGSAYTPPAAVGIFTDVPQADPFAPWIEELYNRGVVAGCGGGAYCPDSPVLRQQMAVFLLKTLLGSGYTPPAAAGLFGDVPIANPFAPWIEDLYNRSIAAGCGSGNFCPTNSTTRGQMAPFLVKTFGMLLYGP